MCRFYSILSMLMFSGIASFLSHCSSSTLQRTTAAQPSTLCMGSPQAKNFAVYLHGQDTPNPSDLELNNRKNLAHLAEVWNFRIALPRATLACPNKPNLLCWGWRFDESVARSALHAIETAAQDCFPQASSIGLIGFSSGGYLANQVFQHQLTQKLHPQIVWILSIGSTFGSWQATETKNLYTGGVPLVFLIGLQDSYNRDPKNDYLNFLKSHGGNRYNGHIISIKKAVPFNQYETNNANTKNCCD